MRRLIEVHTAATADKTIQAIRRRLEKWELEHLRALAAELQERLERAEAEAAEAWASADFWQRNGMQLQEDLMNAGLTVGITKEGQMGAVKSEEPPCAA